MRRGRVTSHLSTIGRAAKRIYCATLLAILPRGLAMTSVECSLPELSVQNAKGHTMTSQVDQTFLCRICRGLARRIRRMGVAMTSPLMRLGATSRAAAKLYYLSGIQFSREQQAFLAGKRR